MEELLEQLVSAVSVHYPNAQARPLLLSTFGQKHPELLTQLKEAFGSLKQAIKAAGDHRLRLVSEVRGSEAVAPSHLAAEVGHRLEELVAGHRAGAANFDCLPGPVRLAFAAKTDAGEQIAIQTMKPFRFTRVTDAGLIAPTQRIIADEYRRPGTVLRNAAVQERAALWSSFLAWSQAVGIDPKIFETDTTTALGRLIAAQPSDIISRLVIPADIAQLLMKHN